MRHSQEESNFLSQGSGQSLTQLTYNNRQGLHVVGGNIGNNIARGINTGMGNNINNANGPSGLGGSRNQNPL